MSSATAIAMRMTAPLLVILMLGCAGRPHSPERHFRLAVPTPNPASASPLLAGTLVVDRPRSDSLLDERPLLFRPSRDSSELQQHALSSWTDAPASLVQSAVVEYFGAAGVADPVVATGLGIRPDWIVASRLVRLERVGGGEPAVDVELELAWLRTPGRTLALARRYRVTRAAATGDVDDAVTAMGLALGEILGEAVRDLRTGLQEEPQDPPHPDHTDREGTSR